MSVRVDDKERQGYLELENFWSEIHEQAIKEGLAQRWMVWEFTYEDEEASKGKPDFLVMNFYKDSIQKSKTANLNFKDYAKKVYKGKKHWVNHLMTENIGETTFQKSLFSFLPHVGSGQAPTLQIMHGFASQHPKDKHAM